MIEVFVYALIKDFEALLDARINLLVRGLAPLGVELLTELLLCEKCSFRLWNRLCKVIALGQQIFKLFVELFLDLKRFFAAQSDRKRESDDGRVQRCYLLT